MKLSFTLLFIMVLLLVVKFTKLNAFFPIKFYWILILFVVFCILRFFEIHRENKKRSELVSEIRGY